MNQNVDRMICNLTPAINKKCEELQTVRKEQFQSRLFILLCALIVTLPALLVFGGISLAALIAPVLFMSLSIVILLPALLCGKTAEQGETIYEQA